MAINKLIYQDDNDALVQAALLHGQAMTTLIETDRGIKSAASELISKELLEKYRPEDDNTACIHLIAMGNSDQYGYNRNGDWFSGDVLEKKANTFVKYGHMFREHANKDPKKAIGSIKYAGYDPNGMQRVELIVHMDKDKAEEEYAMAKSGKALNFSMSCRVPNDRCSCCGNEAKTISSYCDHLKYQMGLWIDKSANYAYAYNDDPTFFDISKVKNPADRIARHLEYLWHDDNGNEMRKAAAAGQDVIIPSAIAAQAEGVDLGMYDISTQSILEKLADAEDYINSINEPTDERAFACQSSYPFALTEKLTQDELNTFRSVLPGTLFRKLAKLACVLSFPAFCQYITGNENIVNSDMFKQASLMLPGVFGVIRKRITIIPNCIDEFSAGTDIQEKNDPNSDEVQALMDTVEDKFSMQPEKIKSRVIKITITCGSAEDCADKVEKAAAVNVNKEQSLNLALAYALYQIKAASDISEINTDFEVTLNTIDAIAASNTILVFDR